MKSERISPFWVNGYQPFSAIKATELVSNAACIINLTSAQVSVIPPSEIRVYPKIWLA